ncbi:Pancreatic lipase-related protein 2 [Zootermopsis nevadensis]|uniref:Pancreatic lipase-related protein 2 n=1 Tax=Zootermopsis nevadensis TaxID=136037 RepID=A0A067QPW6_ZOONE|nr:Pancreatic lipase-related protein 2 [Zootermopsis nevadensis]
MLADSLLLCSITVNVFLGEETVKYTMRPKGNYFFGCPVNETEDISFLLYTRFNPRVSHRLYLDDDESLTKSYINKSQSTVVYIHGFTEKASGLSASVIRDAYLDRGFYNVILVDWNALAAFPWYFAAVQNCQVVGSYLARFLDYLDSKGFALTNVHVVGFSLGAEVAGFTGQHLRAGMGPRLPRITGLDPAYPLFKHHNVKLRLSKGDAIFVDVIHTDGGVLGIPSRIGHADFFPNGGRPVQPGCDVASIFFRASFEDLVFCSHKRSWKYYAESINDEFGFPAYRCRNWMDFRIGHCSSVSGTTYMGIATRTSASGKYFLQTNPNPPFAKKRDNSVEFR